jgi:hypothetical protein
LQVSQVARDDEFGSTRHTNVSTNQDVAINDYTQVDMESEIPPKTKLQPLSNAGLLQVSQGTADGLSRTKPLSRKIA